MSVHRRRPHDNVASMAGEGMAGVYALRRGTTQPWTCGRSGSTRPPACRSRLHRRRARLATRSAHLRRGPDHDSVDPVGHRALQYRLIGFVEASREDDTDKNRLCTATGYRRADVVNYADGWLNTQRGFHVWMADPDVADWLSTCSLSAFGKAGPYLGDPATSEAFGRMVGAQGPARSRTCSDCSPRSIHSRPPDPDRRLESAVEGFHPGGNAFRERAIDHTAMASVRPVHQSTRRQPALHRAVDTRRFASEFGVPRPSMAGGVRGAHSASTMAHR